MSLTDSIYLLCDQKLEKAINCSFTIIFVLWQNKLLLKLLRFDVKIVEQNLVPCSSCGNSRIFLPLGFYVKSTFSNSKTHRQTTNLSWQFFFRCCGFWFLSMLPLRKGQNSPKPYCRMKCIVEIIFFFILSNYWKVWNWFHVKCEWPNVKSGQIWTNFIGVNTRNSL